MLFAGLKKCASIKFNHLNVSPGIVTGLKQLSSNAQEIDKQQQSSPLSQQGGGLSWLEQQMVNTWILGLETRCKRLVGLNGNEEQLKQIFLQQFNNLTKKYYYLVADERSKVHLKFACLTCTGYRVYGQWLKDNDVLKEAIKAQNGQDIVTHVAQRLGQFLTICRVNLFRQDPFQIAKNLQQHQVSDLGEGFGVEQRSINDSQSDLIIRSCIYYKIFKEEGMEHLCQISCCSLDETWFDWMKEWGIQYKKSEWLLDGNKCCRLQLTKQI
eukprot:TRINITY_DN18134_c0_g1_i1.p1 TRINITY_DN18134_c0_g1~~TRINITY_DN18134_c0_g1_i1.p1  ORF type:complete len:280 (+),score=24.64 TRINITY_DN18134_c0_g1_i1:36-842(+)